MAFDETLAGRVSQLLSRHRNIVEKKMFGGIAYLLCGNLLVGVRKNSMIVRLGVEQSLEALCKPFVKVFDITGRPMKGWVVVQAEGLEDDQQLLDWINRAKKFVKTLPAK